MTQLVTTDTLSSKLLRVQRNIDKATKGSANPHFKSRYADLNEVLEVAKEALNEVGIFIAQVPGKDQNGQYVETSLIDGDSGQSLSGKVYFSGNEDNLQKIGAAITYARRFGLKSLLAMEDADDDGETAVGRGNVKGNGGEARAGATSAGRNDSSSSVGQSQKNTPVQGKVPASPSRETTLKEISLASKVIIDSKRDTQDNVVKMLTAYGVKTKEELNDEQALKLLSQLTERLK